jgi:hypothetical protein
VVDVPAKVRALLLPEADVGKAIVEMGDPLSANFWMNAAVLALESAPDPSPTCDTYKSAQVSEAAKKAPPPTIATSNVPNPRLTLPNLRGTMKLMQLSPVARRPSRRSIQPST